MNWIAIVMVSWTCGATAEPPQSALRIQDARLETSTEGGDAKTRFVAVAVNELDEPVEALDIGLLLGREDVTLNTAQVADIYAGKLVEGFHYQRFTMAQVIPARERAMISHPVQVPSDSAPQLFAHLLGYELSILSEASLLKLLDSRAAADETAVLQSLGFVLQGGAWQLKADRLKPDPTMLSWLEKLDADWPLKPTLRDLKQLCVGAIAASLEDSAASRNRLQMVAERGDIERFDEPLQLLRTARLTSTPLASPLAFVMPDEPATMAGVLGVMMQPGWSLASPPAPAPETKLVEQPSRAEPFAGWIGWLGLLLGLFVLFCYRRLRGAGSTVGQQE